MGRKSIVLRMGMRRGLADGLVLWARVRVSEYDTKLEKCMIQCSI